MQNLIYLIQQIENSQKFQERLFYNEEDIFFESCDCSFISKEDFIKIYQSNIELYLGYFGTKKDFLLLAKMILFNLNNNELCTEEELDSLFPSDKKSLQIENLSILILDIQDYNERYSVLMQKEWDNNSIVYLIYTDYNCDYSVLPPSTHKYSLPLAMIKAELLEDCPQILQQNNKFNLQNLSKMIHYYAIKGTYLPIENLND